VVRTIKHVQQHLQEDVSAIEISLEKAA
jgi:hypothetical protein